MTILIEYDLEADPIIVDGAEAVDLDKRAVFQEAVDYWENIIVGYDDGLDRTVTIYASTFLSGGDTGSLNVGKGAWYLSGLTNLDADRRVPTTGRIRLNSNPRGLVNGTFRDRTVKHEIGHVLGLGELWSVNNVHENGSGKYTGINGVAAFNREFGLNYDYVPVEIDGGPGTANVHWNSFLESDQDGEPGDDFDPLVVSGQFAGQNFGNDLLASSGGRGPQLYLSDTSLGALRDMGYNTIAYSVPEPSSSILLALGSLALIRRRR